VGWPSHAPVFLGLLASKRPSTAGPYVIK